MLGSLGIALIPGTHHLVRKSRINPAPDNALTPQAISWSALEVFVASPYIKFSMRRYLRGEACQ